MTKKPLIRTFDITGFEKFPDIGSLKIICELFEEMQLHDEDTGNHSVKATLFYINSKFGKDSK